MPDDERPLFVRPHPNAMSDKVAFLCERYAARSPASNIAEWREMLAL